MERTPIKHHIVELRDLKANLRLENEVEYFDQDLLPKLRAAIAHAGSYLGRDLSVCERLSFSYGGNPEPIELDPAMIIRSVTVAGQKLAWEDWAVYKDRLVLPADTAEGAEVVVETRYRDDVRVAILMHASYMWEHPQDTVETLDKASAKLLAQYRYYNG